MARLRENNFRSLIGGFTKKFDDIKKPKISADLIIQAGLYDEVFQVYKNLGGILSYAPLSFGKFDIIVDSKIIELDEEAHFNRYRDLTLTSTIYQRDSYFDNSKYSKYCKLFESVCLKERGFGGYWTNPSAEKQFGISNSKGDLTGNGSARWKQRAFYDYLKDLIPIIFFTPVIRFSIYDKIEDNSGNSCTVNQILLQNDIKRFKYIFELIKSY